jgi:hypothetical protein
MPNDKMVLAGKRGRSAEVSPRSDTNVANRDAFPRTRITKFSCITF